MQASARLAGLFLASVKRSTLLPVGDIWGSVEKGGIYR